MHQMDEVQIAEVLGEHCHLVEGRTQQSVCRCGVPLGAWDGAADLRYRLHVAAAITALRDHDPP